MPFEKLGTGFSVNFSLVKYKGERVSRDHLKFVVSVIYRLSESRLHDLNGNCTICFLSAAESMLTPHIRVARDS